VALSEHRVELAAEPSISLPPSGAA
jgi:hypothetical protein